MSSDAAIQRATFAYPSIEFVLATAHYPEPYRSHARVYPTFFPAPPVQLFHVAHGHIPLFAPAPHSPAQTQRQQTIRRETLKSTSRVLRFRIRPSSEVAQASASNTACSQSILQPIDPDISQLEASTSHSPLAYNSVSPNSTSSQQVKDSQSLQPLDKGKGKGKGKARAVPNEESESLSP